MRERLETAERLCMDAGLSSEDRPSNMTSRQLSTDSISSDHTNVSSSTTNKGQYDHFDHQSGKKKSSKHRSWVINQNHRVSIIHNVAKAERISDICSCGAHSREHLRSVAAAWEAVNARMGVRTIALT